MIYSYLFFKSYQLAKKSKNFDDAPILGGIWGVMPCIIMNFFTLIFLVEILFDSNASTVGTLFKQYKFVFAAVFVGIIYLYFRHGGRWKRIVAKYKLKEQETGRSIHPAIVLPLAYIISVTICILTGMYMNGDL